MDDSLLGRKFCLRHILFFAMLPALAFIFFSPNTANSFVIMNTSEPALKQQDSTQSKKDSTSLIIRKIDSLPLNQSKPDTTATIGFDGNVLFLSSRDKEFYVHLGILMALEDLELQPDAIIGEGFSTILAAGWAMGYSARDLYGYFRDYSLESLLHPITLPQPRKRGPWMDQESLPLRLVFRNIGDQGTFQPGFSFNSPLNEHTHFSWWLANFCYHSPTGPVLQMEHLKKPIGFQMSNIQKGKVETITEGDIQNLIKASVLPNQTVQDQRPAGNYINGNFFSTGQFLGMDLHTPANFIYIKVPKRIIPREWNLSGQYNKKDSIWQTAMVYNNQLNYHGIAGDSVIIRIRNRRENEEQVRATWIQWGYLAALEMADVFREKLTSVNHDPNQSIYSGFSNQLDLKNADYSAPSASGLIVMQHLMENEARLYKNEAVVPAGNYPVKIEKIISTGMFSNLDLRLGEGKTRLLFSAEPKNWLSLEAGANSSTYEKFTGQGLLRWRIPFYLPMQLQSGIQIQQSGHAYGASGVLYPFLPWPISLKAIMLQENKQFQSIGKSSGWEPVELGFDQGLLEMGIYGNWERIRGHLTFSRTSFADTQSSALSFFSDQEIFEFSQGIDLQIVSNFDFLPEINAFGDAYFRNIPPSFLTESRSHWAFETGTRAKFGPVGYHAKWWKINQSIIGTDLLGYYLQNAPDFASFSDKVVAGKFLSNHFWSQKLLFQQDIFGIDLMASAGVWQNLGISPQYPIDAFYELIAGKHTLFGPARLGMTGLLRDSPLFFAQIGVNLDLEKALKDAD